MPRFTINKTGGIGFVCLCMAWSLLPQANAKPERPMTLLGTLEEWRYPDSQPLFGATISDGSTLRGGVRTVGSSRCESILATPHGFGRVVDFYVKKFGILEENGPTIEPVDAPDGGQSVFSQNDSLERPFQLRVIPVNRDDSSTTLVISRAESETVTHVAWSHYSRQ